MENLQGIFPWLSPKASYCEDLTKHLQPLLSELRLENSFDVQRSPQSRSTRAGSSHSWFEDAVPLQVRRSYSSADGQQLVPLARTPEAPDLAKTPLRGSPHLNRTPQSKLSAKTPPSKMRKAHFSSEASTQKDVLPDILATTLSNINMLPQEAFLDVFNIFVDKECKDAGQFHSTPKKQLSFGPQVWGAGMSPTTTRYTPSSAMTAKHSPLSVDALNDGRFRGSFCERTFLARGQFASVYRCKNNIDQQMYAVKVLRRGHNKDMVTKEIEALASVSGRSEHIVRYYSSWFEDDCLYIQTELCEGSLRDRMVQRIEDIPHNPRYGETELRPVMLDVSRGLATLHEANLAHVDIKPDNILIGRDHLYKLADFGLVAQAVGGRCERPVTGDCRYVASESLRVMPCDKGKSDVFSLGLTCYEAASIPIALPQNGIEWQKLREGVMNLALVDHLPPSFVVLLQRLLHKEPKERPTSREISSDPTLLPLNDVEALKRAIRDAEQVLAARCSLAQKHQLEPTALPVTCP